MILLFLWLPVGCTDNSVQVVGASPERSLIFTGVVRDLTLGVPVDSALVHLPAIDRATRTDSGGSFRFEGILPGTYRCEITAVGFLGIGGIVDLDPLDKGATDHVHAGFLLPQRSRNLRLHIVDARDFAPLSDVAVGLEYLPEADLGEGFDLLRNQDGLRGETNSDGNIELSGLPEGPVACSATGVDLDGDGHPDLAGSLRTIDLRAQGEGARDFPLFPASPTAPVVVATNAVEGSGVANAPLYYEFDREMNTDPRLYPIANYSVDRDRIRVEWVTSRRLVLTALDLVFMEYGVQLRVYDREGNGLYYAPGFSWFVEDERDFAHGECEAVVEGLVLETPTDHLNFDTRLLEFSWPAIECANGYLVYARDDRRQIDWREIDWIPYDFGHGMLNCSFELPGNFDYISYDDLITPLAGTRVEVCVMPANAQYEDPGAPHPVIAVTDHVAPHLVALEQVDAAYNDTDAPQTMDLRVLFSEFMRTDSPRPTLTALESGGDPDFVLSPSEAQWMWDRESVSGRFRFVLQPGQNAARDVFRVSTVDGIDLSGNLQPTSEATGPVQLESAASCDFEAGPAGWVAGYGSDWMWGKPDPARASAYSGEYCWWTNAGRNDGYANGSFYSSPVKLDMPNPQLSFHYSFDLLDDDGVFQVLVDDGTGWQAIWAIGSQARSWSHRVLDLRSYEDRTVRIGFDLYSRIGSESPGALIDLVEISSGG